MDAPYHHFTKHLANSLSASTNAVEQNAASDANLCQNKLFVDAYDAQGQSIQQLLSQNELATKILLQEEIIAMSRLLLLDIRLLSAINQSYLRAHYRNNSFNYSDHDQTYGIGNGGYPNLYINNPDTSNLGNNDQDSSNSDASSPDTSDLGASDPNINNSDITNLDTHNQNPNIDYINRQQTNHKSFFPALHQIGSSAAHIVAAARHNIGRPVWAFTKFASICQAGYEGCAATVSELLQEGGVSITGSACVSGLVKQLSDLGWHKIKISDKRQFHNGDIVYGLKGSHAHIGIISQVNNNQVLVCDNSSSSGTLKERSIESGGSFTPNGRFAGSLYVMRKES